MSDTKLDTAAVASVITFLQQASEGKHPLPNLVEPDLGDLWKWKRLLGHVESVLGYVKSAMNRHEAFLAEYATKREVGQLGDSNLTVTMREDVRYNVKDWTKIDKSFMQKRITETEVKRALDDPHHPFHMDIHRLLAGGDIETTPFTRITIRRKPGAS